MKRVLVIGAGIIGLYTAYHLLSRNFRVEVIEREGEIGKGISGSNAGVLHLIQQPFNSVKSILAREGVKRYREYADIFGFDIYETSLYIVGYNLFDKLYLNIIATLLRREGFNTTLGSDRRPFHQAISKKAKNYLKVDGYGVVEPQDVLRKIAEYLMNKGVEIHLSTSEYERDRYDYIVVAAGPYTYDIGLKLGDEVPKHRYGLGVMINVDVEIDAIYTLPPNPLKKYTKGGAAIPKKDHTLLGPGFKWVKSPDEPPSNQDIDQVYKRFEKLFNEPPEILSTSYGVRPINYPKDDFIIKKKDKYIFTYGIDSPGFTAAPVIGEIIANMIVDKERYIELSLENLKKYIT